ncbi:alpha/beta fold hydrolase [uncultured Tateyamaria sp.]|uniref:alpha/beta fold hydrolase n=1 Tax=uncultured Tateyamaria sp. TaxID=455651 RepID=UPI00262F9FF6|nr:alpha/beta fold hydrolase [uncultured Tateyamaria sp.]
MSDLTNDIGDLLEHLGVGRAHLVGLSLGGMTFQHLAARRNQLVIDSPTLIATSAYVPPP